jgi:hypothetical protein
MHRVFPTLFVVGFTLANPSAVLATEIVYDPVQTVQNVVEQVIDRLTQAGQHAEDMVKYARMIENQTQQIGQLTTMISQNVQQLDRLGNPVAYVNMLSLNTLVAEIQRTMNGVGTTIAEFGQTANGVMALKNTANGLYQDLSQLKDQFGNSIQLRTDLFTKYGVVQNMYQSFQNEMVQANQALASLLRQKQEILQQVNSAASLIETEKLKSELEAVDASVNSATARLSIYSQKILVQNAANQNDTARMQEAQRQQWQQQAWQDDMAMQGMAIRMFAPAN